MHIQSVLFPCNHPQNGGNTAGAKRGPTAAAGTTADADAASRLVAGPATELQADVLITPATHEQAAAAAAAGVGKQAMGGVAGKAGSSAALGQRALTFKGKQQQQSLFQQSQQQQNAEEDGEVVDVTPTCSAMSPELHVLAFGVSLYLMGYTLQVRGRMVLVCAYLSRVSKSQQALAGAQARHLQRAQQLKQGHAFFIHTCAV